MRPPALNLCLSLASVLVLLAHSARPGALAVACARKGIRDSHLTANTRL
jgi:hypothetical protein